MEDFRETLEVAKNSSCFLSYSFCKRKEDLATEEGPTCVEYSDEATLGEVSDLIESFCEKEDQCFDAIQTLINTGRVEILKPLK